MKIYNIINIPKGLSQEIECDCREEYNSGYTAGYADGLEACSGESCEGVWEEGYDSGVTDGYESGYTSGYTDGQESVDCEDFYNSGVTDGYESGYTSGRTDGYQDGWQPGYDSGYTDGQESVDCSDFYDSGYTSGRTDGYNSGITAGEEAQKAKLSAITIDKTYYPNTLTRADGWSAITVDIPVEKWKHYTATTNGQYFDIDPDTGYEAMYGVKLAVNVPDRYNEGYNSGYTDGLNDCSGGSCEGVWAEGYASGVTDQKNKLMFREITKNGYYQAPDGFYAVDVNVPDRYQEGYTSGHTDGYEDGWQPGYQSGYTDGVNASCGDYASGYTDGFEDGYDSGYTDGQASVDCQDCYNSGYTSGVTDGFGSGYTSGVTDGEEAQKAKLTFTAFTTNGTYTRADGWSAVTVNVPQTGYTQQDLDNAFNSGWTGGYSSGYTDGLNDCTGSTAATSLSFNVPSYVTDGAETSVSVSPSSADVDIVYESDNESAATIDSAGTITVLEDGAEVTFCATDLNSGLQDCQTRTVYTGRAAADVTLVYELQNTQGRRAQLSSEEFLSTVDKMYIDGVEVTPVSAHTFDTYGHHTVEYYISSSYHQIIPSAFAQLSNPAPYGVIITPRPEVHPTFEIGASSFFYTQMSAVTIAEGVTSMGFGAFNNTAVRHIAIPNSLTVIPSRAFVQNRCLETVNLGTGVTTIYDEAFMSCATLSSIVIPDTVQTIYQAAFLACSSMTNATIGTGVTTMGTRVFEACTNLRSVDMRGVINGGVIPACIFKDCTKLTDCVIPSGTTVINYDAFNACHLSAITVPEGVTDVKDGAFINNSFATAVTLPSTIVNIGTHGGSGLSTFGGLTINTRFTINATTPPALGETSGANASLGYPGVPIYVPAGSVEAYKASSDYVIYKDYIQAIQ